VHGSLTGHPVGADRHQRQTGREIATDPEGRCRSAAAAVLAGGDVVDPGARRDLFDRRQDGLVVRAAPPPEVLVAHGIELGLRVVLVRLRHPGRAGAAITLAAPRKVPRLPGLPDRGAHADERLASVRSMPSVRTSADGEHTSVVITAVTCIDADPRGRVVLLQADLRPGSAAGQNRWGSPLNSQATGYVERDMPGHVPSGFETCTAVHDDDSDA